MLANLAAAVTVQAPDGTLVYVNQAAAEMMGCSSPDEMLAMPLAELLDAFVILDEDGRPTTSATFPGATRWPVRSHARRSRTRSSRPPARSAGR